MLYQGTLINFELFQIIRIAAASIAFGMYAVISGDAWACPRSHSVCGLACIKDMLALSWHNCYTNKAKIPCWS